MNTVNTIFILNPISGVVKRKNLPGLIQKYFKGEYNIVETQYAGHAKEIAKQAVETGVKNIIAIGGDGTINEIAQSLVHTEANLGIIPLGSGNGLARHLKIPLNTIKAIEALNSFKPNLIDSGTLNGHLFLCTAGIGLDAEVTHDFASRSTRGLKTYIKSSFSLWGKIKNQNFRFSIDKKEAISENGIVFTVANASQYGNNAIISPLSLINDGVLELCILPKLGLINTITHLIKVFRGTLDQSSKACYYSLKRLDVQLVGETKAHVDGEPIMLTDAIVAEILPQSLKVLS